MKLLGMLMMCFCVIVYAEPCQKVVYSGHSNYPPFQWQQDGKIVGAAADVTELILNELKILFESRAVGPWNRVLMSAKQGSIDLVLGLKQVPERKTYLSFIEAPFYQNPVSVFVVKDRAFTFESWEDLIGRKGTLNLGDRHGAAFDAFVNAKLDTERVNGLRANFNLLVSGRTDYFITGLYTGRSFLEKFPDSDKVTFLPQPVLHGVIHHGFSKASDCLELQAYFNQRLQELNDQGVISALVEDNLKKWHAYTPTEYQNTRLKVGLLLANFTQGKSYRALFDQFEETYPNIQIELQAYEDEEYKKRLQQWVREKQGPDVFYWQGGERLFELVRQGVIRDVDTLWNSLEWNRKFSPRIKKLLSYQQRAYALPFAYYQWGFYYKKSLFKRLNLQPPRSWAEFLSVAEALASQELDVFAIGTKHQWPAAGWFDFFNLRLNGLRFYQSLLAGKTSYYHPKVRQVFEHWKRLIDLGYFNADHDELTWSQAMALLYREQAGLTLIGNFAERKFPAKLEGDIGFFPFPMIDPQMNRFELMPVEVFVLSSWSKKPSETRALLKFLSEPLSQLSLSDDLGYIPATNEARDHVTALSLEGAKLLDDSRGIMQYFDRDTDQAFATAAVAVLADFLNKPDIEATTQSLEALRLALKND
ncbi:extracellular solute-binding protein [Litoribrevibacter euphylliae]|uniref:Extracellular solute-binding protein n=1 Tax=Litoribrevibacter euphylliae TaxID=1834034 RepID=A0ABV7HNQ2_9GAMM